MSPWGPWPRDGETPALDVSTGYALWAPTYPRSATNELMRLEQREMLRLLPPLRDAAVLDLGCGSGRYLSLTAPGRARFAVGFDSSPAMLARARETGAALVQAALPSLPLRAGVFDVVLCGLVVGHLPDLRAVMHEIARVLRPGGVALYSDVHPDGARLGWRRTFVAPDATEYAIRHFVHTLDEHRAACAAAGLLIEEIAEPRVEQAERWRGTPAVLVVRARRGAAGPRG